MWIMSKTRAKRRARAWNSTPASPSRGSAPRHRATIRSISRDVSACTKAYAAPGYLRDDRRLAPEHQHEVLHRRARRAFAEIVEFGDEQRLAARLVGEHVDLDVVGPVQRFRLDARGVFAVHHMEMLLAPVVLFEDSAEVGGFRLARESGGMQRQGAQHPLAEVAHRGLEDRPRAQAGIELDFGHVLVLELKPVELERRRLARLIGLDHRLAAARIAADRADRNAFVLGD